MPFGYRQKFLPLALDMVFPNGDSLTYITNEGLVQLGELVQVIDIYLFPLL